MNFFIKKCVWLPTIFHAKFKFTLYISIRILGIFKKNLEIRGSCLSCQLNIFRNKVANSKWYVQETSCQHHVCRDCQGGRKSLTPSCSWCKDYSKYTENPQLKILLQSYRSLCSYIKVIICFHLWDVRGNERARSLLKWHRFVRIDI